MAAAKKLRYEVRVHSRGASGSGQLVAQLDDVTVAASVKGAYVAAAAAAIPAGIFGSYVDVVLTDTKTGEAL
jgi:hypothetical protein